jgi:hypothetical protein
VKRATLLLIILMMSYGCAARRPPATIGEQASGFGYVPLDGLGIIQAYDVFTCHQDQDYQKPRIAEWRPILDALPDVSVRFAVASVEGGGALAFGPAKVTAEGRSYRAVLDYVNVDAVPVPFYARKLVRAKSGGVASNRGILAALDPAEEVVSYEARVYYGNPNDETPLSWVRDGFDPITVPVYVGIGMRLTADIRAIKGGITLASLAAIASEAQANALSGTLTVQTLGVTGSSVATSLPLPSKLDQTTVENGIMALGSSRALIYGDDSATRKTARIVGLYSPVTPDPRLINLMYSQLASNRPSWFRPCGPPVR